MWIFLLLLSTVRFSQGESMLCLFVFKILLLLLVLGVERFFISNETLLKCINKIQAISMQIAVFLCYSVSGLKKLLQMNYVYSISYEWIALVGVFWIYSTCRMLNLRMLSSQFCIKIIFLCSMCQTLLWIVQNQFNQAKNL